MKTGRILLIGIFFGFLVGQLLSVKQVAALAINLQTSENSALRWEIAALGLQDRVAFLESDAQGRVAYDVMVSALVADRNQTGSGRLGTAAVSADLTGAGFTKGRKIYIEGFGVFVIDSIFEKSSQPLPRMKVFTDSSKQQITDQRLLKALLLG